MSPEPVALPPDAAPAPQRVQVLTVNDATGKGWVLVLVHAATGSHCTFLEPDAAETVGAELVRLAPRARSGLLIAGNGDVTP